MMETLILRIHLRFTVNVNHNFQYTVVIIVDIEYLQCLYVRDYTNF